MAKIDALFTKSLTFLIWILNFPPPAGAFWKIYTYVKVPPKNTFINISKVSF